MKSIASSEIFTTAKAAHNGKMIVKVYKALLDTDIDLVIVVYSQGLLTAPITQSHSIEKSPRGDVFVTRFELETKKYQNLYGLLVG